ncbi:RagB/SusD family nutrient uptake outer membrane protein [Joostella sp. CR20]|uniref:RagB/SusD family nutrient uptake outer membrane protein n=1 Tax=Joostella sp. CR20 TaxID=2804312 RepID=UPI00313B4BDD
MKKLSIFTISIAMLTLGSCTKDYLDTEPLTELTDQNFYKTKSDAYDALVGCYDGMQIAEGASAIPFALVSEVISDDCFGGTGNSDTYSYQALDEFDPSRSPSDVDFFNDTWTKYYAAIFRCNSLLQKMDQIDWEGDTALRNTYESEARFIRAYMYFDLMRLFGSVPLITVPTTDNVPQAPAEDVYKVIAEDLQFAANNLENAAYTSVESGRITKWAAQAMLARVYMFYTGYYSASDLVGVVTKAEALAGLEDVIANSGHGLVEDFSALWPAASLEDYAGEDNKEVVFSVKYTYTSDYDGNTDGNHWMVFFGMREFDYYPYGRGWGVTATPEVYNAFTTGDARRDASIIAVAEDNIPFENQDKQREYTGYYNKKYTPMIDEDGNSVAEQNGAVNFQIGQFQDYFVIRYADVLLMAAELGSPNAQQYFDEVRERSLGENFTSVAVTQANIYKERRLEFAFEGIRYWDLLRRGVSTAASEIAENTTVLNGGIETTKVISAGKIQATNGLQQIPNTQITLSDGVLKQNAGW